MSRTAQTFFAAYWRNRYRILFISLLLSFIAVPILDEFKMDNSWVHFFVSINLGLAILGEANKSYFRFLVILIATAVLIRSIDTMVESDLPYLLSIPLLVVVAVGAIFSAVSSAVKARRISSEHLFAALTGYLLIGMAFAYLYWTIETFRPGSFAVANAEGGQGFPLVNAFYFSFVTLTTVGYGDILPLSSILRSLAVVEAVTGQLYVAVMIARLVALYGDQQNR